MDFCSFLSPPCNLLEFTRGLYMPYQNCTAVKYYIYNHITLEVKFTPLFPDPSCLHSWRTGCPAGQTGDHFHLFLGGGQSWAGGSYGLLFKSVFGSLKYLSVLWMEILRWDFFCMSRRPVHISHRSCWVRMCDSVSVQ